MLDPIDLEALHKACFTTPRPWSAAEFAGLLSSYGVFIVCGDGPSFAMGRVVAGEAELLTLAVTPDAQGKGLGRAVMELFETRAHELGSEEIFLEVSTENTPAIALYTSFGYSESGVRPKYYTAPCGAKIDAIVMMKPLK